MSRNYYQKTKDGRFVLQYSGASASLRFNIQFYKYLADLAKKRGYEDLSKSMLSLVAQKTQSQSMSKFSYSIKEAFRQLGCDNSDFDKNYYSSFYYQFDIPFIIVDKEIAQRSYVSKSDSDIRDSLIRDAKSNNAIFEQLKEFLQSELKLVQSENEKIKIPVKVSYYRVKTQSINYEFSRKKFLSHHLHLVTTALAQYDGAIRQGHGKDLIATPLKDFEAFWQQENTIFDNLQQRQLIAFCANCDGSSGLIHKNYSHYHHASQKITNNIEEAFLVDESLYNDILKKEFTQHQLTHVAPIPLSISFSLTALLSSMQPVEKQNNAAYASLISLAEKQKLSDELSGNQMQNKKHKL